LDFALSSLDTALSVGSATVQYNPNHIAQLKTMRYTTAQTAIAVFDKFSRNIVTKAIVFAMQANQADICRL
jgi:hypothetical protein